MLLIQTAFEQEFKAVISALRRVGPGADCGIKVRGSNSGQGDSRRLVQGWIGDHHCWVLKSGIGQPAAAGAVTATLAGIERPRLIISIGFAGALDPEVRVGEKFLIREVRLCGSEPRSLFPALNQLASSPESAPRSALLVTCDQPVVTPQAKANLSRETSALLCDMESHAVANVAAEHGMPWLGARIVSDSAEETLKAWVLQLPELVERRHWGGLMRLLCTHPQDLPGLLRLAYRMRALQLQLSQFIVELILNVVET